MRYDHPIFSDLSIELRTSRIFCDQLKFLRTYLKFCVCVCVSINKMELCPICQQAAPFKCTSCKSIHYCGAEHQKKHWPKHKANCRPFKIERSDRLGRYVVATRDIPAKSVIFIEPPLVVGPKWCSGDDEKSSPLFPCVGCFRSTPINANRCPK